MCLSAAVTRRRSRVFGKPSGVANLGRPSRQAAGWLCLIVLVAEALHPDLLRAQVGAVAGPAEVLVRETTLLGGGLEISLVGLERPVRDRDLTYVTNYPNLESLDLAGTNISGVGLTQLYDCRGLRHLNLSFTQITDDGLSALPLFQDLEELDLARTAISDNALRYLTWCPNLTTLRAEGTKIHGEGLRYLPEPLKLRTLDLLHAPIDDKGAAQLSAFTNLTKLRVTLIHVSADSLSSIQDLSELRDLELALPRSATSPSRLRFLGNLEKLLRLRLGMYDARDEDVACLKPLRQLKYLEMPGNGISDEGLVHLSSLHKMTELRLAWPTRYGQVPGGPFSGPATAGPFSDRGIKALGSLPHLKRLSLDGCWFSGSGAKSLSALNQLEYFNLQFSNITDDDLQHLAGLKSLKELDLGHTSVQSLPLPPLPNLETLDLRFTSLVDVDPAQLAKLTNLKRLTLLGASLDDQSWKAIGELHNLRHLDLGSHGLSSNQLRYLLKNLVNLQILSLGELKVDDAAAALLLELKDLRWLGVSGSALQNARNSDLWGILRERGVVVSSGL